MKQRYYNLDILRCCAILFVISLHFLYAIGLDEPNTKYTVFNLFILNMLKIIFYCGVPIFITLSGFLLFDKEWNKKAYIKIFDLLIVYFIINFITLAGNTFILSKPFSIFDFTKHVLQFDYIQYAWYLEMYIGLYLLAPFLNTMFKNLSLNSQRLYIFTLLFLTTLYGYFGKSLYWAGLFPLTFYALGNSFKINKPKTNLKVIPVLLVLSIFIFGITESILTSLFNSDLSFLGQNKIKNLENAVITYLFFSLILSMDFKLTPKIQNLLAFLSKHIYGIFLSSFIVDKITYHILSQIHYWNNLNIGIKALFGIIIVPVVFITSLIISYIVNKFYTAIKQSINKFSAA